MNNKINDIAKVSISTEIGLKFFGKSNLPEENIFCVFNLLFREKLLFFPISSIFPAWLWKDLIMNFNNKFYQQTSKEK